MMTNPTDQILQHSPAPVIASLSQPSVLCPEKMAMSRIIIYNTTVLALDDEDNFYYPGTVEIVNDRITKVYGGQPSDEVLHAPDTLVIDGTDKLVMPGLVDLHFHTSVAKVGHPRRLYMKLILLTPMKTGLWRRAST